MSLTAALAAHEAGDLVKAATLYTVSIAAKVDDAWIAYSNVGTIYADSGRLGEARQHSFAAMQLAPRNADVLYNFANVLMKAGASREAEDIFGSVIHVQPNHAASYNNLALLAHGASESAKAVSHFQAALQCGDAELARIGGAAQVYSNLATVNSRGSPNGALEWQRTAVALAPFSCQAYVSLAQRLQEANPPHLADAEAALITALAISPYDSHAYNALGALLHPQSGRLSETAMAYRHALMIDPTAGDAYHNLGTVLQRLGSLKEAESLYEHAMGLLPGVPNVYVSLASMSSGDRAEGLLRTAIQLQPREFSLYTRLASVIAPRALGGKKHPARHELQRALAEQELAAQIAPQNAHVQSERGRLLLATSAALLAEATDAHRSAASLNPADASLCNNAALLAAASGEAVAARALFSEGLNRAKSKMQNGVLAQSIEAFAHWRRISDQVASTGYAVVDGAAGVESATELEREMQHLLPIMTPGRVGMGLSNSGVRADVLWRHRRDDTSALSPAAPHVQAMHALLDAVPLSLNQLQWLPDGKQGELACGNASSQGTGCTACSRDRVRHAAWALAAVEDVQMACYLGGGFYRRHSDAQHSSRRVVTAIYYPNTKWIPGMGGELLLHLPAGRPETVNPIADRLVLFRSDIDHEELPMTAGAPPRCAVTQWLQNLAPPLIASRGISSSQSNGQGNPRLEDQVGKEKVPRTKSHKVRRKRRGFHLATATD